MKMKSVLLFVLLCLVIYNAEALKCKSEDGPSEEVLEKVVRSCMLKAHRHDGQGQNGSRSSEENDSSNSSEEDNRRGNNNRNKGQQTSGSSTPHNVRTRRDSHSQNQDNDYNNGGRGRSNTSSSLSEHDKSCVIHCFLDEMKMTNDKEMPDKNKVSQVLTKDLKNRELKDFMQDSVTECFQVLELDNRKEKCEFSKNLLSCLAERGKANCEDWDEFGSLPFK